MKITAYLFIIFAIISTFYFAILSMGDEVSIKGLVITLAVSIPYFAGMGLLLWFKSRSATVTTSLVMIALSLLGSYMLYSSTLLHPDAQSGLAFFVVPVFQFPIILIAAVAGWFMERKAAKNQ